MVNLMKKQEKLNAAVRGHEEVDEKSNNPRPDINNYTF